MVWPRKLYPVWMEAITSRITRNYKEKTKSIFDKKKKEASSEEKKSGSQQVNNSLTFF